MLTYGWLKLSSNQHQSPLKSSFLIPFRNTSFTLPSLRPSFRPLLFKTHVLRSYTLSTNQLCFPSIHPLHFSSSFFFFCRSLSLHSFWKCFPCRCFIELLIAVVSASILNWKLYPRGYRIFHCLEREKEKASTLLRQT